MPADTNQRDPSGIFVSGISASIVDASLLQASSYKLTADSSGTYTLTRQSDGYARTVVDGDSIDGFKLSFTPAAPLPGESFVIEPVGAAAANFRRVLDLPSGIAATAADGFELGQQHRHAQRGPPLRRQRQTRPHPVAHPARLWRPRPGRRHQGAVHVDPGRRHGAERHLVGRPAIGNEPALGIDLGFELRTNGVPRKNDRITLEPTIYTGTNNGNAKAFLDIQSETFVGRRVKPDGSIAVGSTITDAYASSMSEIGARVQGATYLSSVSTTTANDARTAAGPLGRQPRRRGRPPYPVPAGLPGRRQGHANRTDHL